MATFLKKCPKCGKRFEVERTGETMQKKTDLAQEDGEVIPPTIVAGGIPIAAASTLSNNPPVIRHETVIKEEEEFTETYECKHCGHIWTETHEKVKEKEVEGSGSDI